MAVPAFLRNLVHRAGLDIRLRRNVERNKREEYLDKWVSEWTFLNQYNPGTVLDLGANEGQFAQMIRRACPDIHVISFEPLPSCFKELERTCETIGNAECFNIAIGAGKDRIDMFESISTPSSSILEMAKIHKSEWPGSGEGRRVSVDVLDLDSFMHNREIPQPFVIKVDVQGFEDQVIVGASETLKSALMIVIETSFVALYDGQPLFDDIYKLMQDSGYRYAGALDTTRSRDGNTILQEDSLFLNESRCPDINN